MDSRSPGIVTRMLMLRKKKRREVLEVERSDPRTIPMHELTGRKLLPSVRSD